jgi:hypothetical protein
MERLQARTVAELTHIAARLGVAAATSAAPAAPPTEPPLPTARPLTRGTGPD